MAIDKVPHEDFNEGYLVGYQAIKGKNSNPPMAPMQTMAPIGMTPFLMGVRRGLKAAGVEID